MTVKKYYDESIAADSDSGIGEYLFSFDVEDGNVSADVFRTSSNILSIYVSKAPSLPVAKANSIVTAIVDQHIKQNKMDKPAKMDVFFTIESIGFSGAC